MFWPVLPLRLGQRFVCRYLFLGTISQSKAASYAQLHNREVELRGAGHYRCVLWSFSWCLALKGRLLSMVFLHSSVQGDPPTYPPQGCRVSGDAAVSGGSAGLCEVGGIRCAAEFATLVPVPRAPSTEELCCKDQISESSPLMNCKRNVVRTQIKQ